MADLQLFQHFPTREVKIDLEWPILAILQLFRYFPIKVVQIDSEWPIMTVLQLFQYFLTKVVQIDLEWPNLALVDLGGCAQHMPPLWDPILLFLHTFSPKSAHVRGPCPP